MANPIPASEYESRPVWTYVRKFWRPFALGTITLALTNLFDILTPFALMKAIDAISGGGRGQLHDGILLYVAFMIGAVSWLRLSSASVRDDPDDFSMLSTDVEDYPPEILGEELALRA